MTDKILDIVGLNKHFGGIYATQDLDFEMHRGAQEAIIGPNGAGKSTLFNLLTGYHRPESGTVVFDGVDITDWAPHRIAQAGISRAFQVSNIFHRMTVFQNVRSAVHAQLGRGISLFGRADRIGIEETEHTIALCGLTDKSEVIAGELSQATRRSWSSPLRWPASRSCCCSTSRPPGCRSTRRTRP